MLRFTRWNPFEELDSLHQEMDRRFGRRWEGEPGERTRAWVPATEVTSDEEGWTVRMALPGVDPKRVEVELRTNTLVVTGERGKKQEDKKRHVSEFGYGTFRRSFTLPENVDTEKVAANFEHGMLELRLPLVTAATPRRIAVTGITPEKAA